MEGEQEQEQKQLYLRKEIIEQNYDPQTFIDFLISKKGETAADINNWNLEELKSVVIEFKSINKNNKISNPMPNLNLNPNSSSEKFKTQKVNIFYNDELNLNNNTKTILIGYINSINTREIEIYNDFACINTFYFLEDRKEDIKKYVFYHMYLLY